MELEQAKLQAMTGASAAGKLSGGEGGTPPIGDME